MPRVLTRRGGGRGSDLDEFRPLDSQSPFHSTHAIYVRKGVTTAASYRDGLPEMMRSRLLSIRAFDANDMLVSADLVEGEQADRVIQKFFEDSSVRFLHVHFAKMGCYGCRIDRV